MFTRLRTSVAAFAALIAVACAPTPVMAADPDNRESICTATATTTVAVLSIEATDKAEQDRFVEWWNSRDVETQVFLSPYLYYGLLLAQSGYPLEAIGQEVYSTCMERRA